MHRLSQNNPQKLIDLLSERLEFEKSSVKLYDAALAKMQASDEAFVKTLLGDVREHRDQEQEHADWLEQQIIQLGGNIDEKTEMARLVETESEGIERVVLDGDSSIAHVVHALLTAELVDNAGWELLLELADEADDADARSDFKKRLHEEEDHLMLMRRAVEVFAANSVLGTQTPAGMA